MNTVWIIVGVGVSCLIAVILRWRGRGRESDLGFVSHQWVAEHRLSQPHDPPR